MPRRVPTPGFADTPLRNEFLRYPGGNLLQSDVNQAAEAMNFGGTGGAPRTAIPWSNPRTSSGEPTVQVWNNQTEGGVLHWNGRPIVESAVEIDPAQTGQDNYDPTKPFFSLPHQAMDFTDAPTYDPSGSQFDQLPGYTYGEPTVETPTATPTQSAGNLDAEPSLFAASSVNPFDEWWKQEAIMTGEVGAGAQLDLGGDGGSIWAEMTAPEVHGVASIGPQESFGGEATADLPEAPFNPIASDTGIPVEPNTLNQDYEWTTSPGDRRFLADAPTAAPSSGPASNLDLGTFGVTPPNNNMSLGAFLNTPLWAMNYGEGYSPNIASGGRPEDLQAGEGYISPETQTGGHWEDTPGGQTFVEDSPGSTGFTGRNDNQSTAFNDVPWYDPSYTLPTGLQNAIGRGDYARAYGASLASQESAKEMSAVQMWGSPSVYAFHPDMPTSFSLGGVRMDAEGGFEQVNPNRVAAGRGSRFYPGRSWRPASMSTTQPAGTGGG